MVGFAHTRFFVHHTVRFADSRSMNYHSVPAERHTVLYEAFIRERFNAPCKRFAISRSLSDYSVPTERHTSYFAALFANNSV